MELPNASVTIQHVVILPLLAFGKKPAIVSLKCHAQLMHNDIVNDILGNYVL